MILEDGKTYMNGWGDRVTVSMISPPDPHTAYIFIGNKGGRYKPNGKASDSDHWTIRDDNLVKILY